MTKVNRTCRFTNRKYCTRKPPAGPHFSPKDLYWLRSVCKSILLYWKHHGDRGHPVILVLVPGRQGTGCGMAAQMGGVRRREGPRLCHLHAHSPTPRGTDMHRANSRLGLFFPARGKGQVKSKTPQSRGEALTVALERQVP